MGAVRSEQRQYPSWGGALLLPSTCGESIRGRSCISVSFLLELQVADLTEEQGRAVEEECLERDAWPVRFRPRRRRRLTPFGLREIGPELWMPDALDRDHHLLSDEAEW